MGQNTKIEYMNTIDAILYINLDSREDRKQSILNEIKKIGFPTSRIHRIPAVYDAVCGHLGCGRSHVAALDLALQHGWKRILVLEDDFHFSATKSELDRFIQDADALQWDVLLLAKGHIRIQEKRGNLHRVKGCSTTSGYIVEQHYYSVLRNNFTESIAYMKQQVDRHIKSCLDPFVTIGKEFETVSIPQGVHIRYGHPDTYWIEKSVCASEIVATNEYFGEDPAPGRLKYVQIYDPAKKVTKIQKLVHGVTAIDQHWYRLQERDRFYIRDPVIGHQGGFGSDTS